MKKKELIKELKERDLQLGFAYLGSAFTLSLIIKRENELKDYVKEQLKRSEKIKTQRDTLTFLWKTLKEIDKKLSFKELESVKEK